ncbi:MAG: T9SS type A sorting domain-containing protein [Elusimicrobia bacterium]|nr:T9SS type A sorting domain-containing protein [Elusimicrobiota bacterium]
MKTFWNFLTLLLLARAACCAALPSGADYQLAASVVDGGGGERMTGGEYAAKGSVGQSALPANPGLSGSGEYSNRTGFYNPPHFTYQAGLPVVLSMASGDIRLTLPPNSVAKDVFEITMNKDPLEQPLAVDPGKITDANGKMVNNEGAWSGLFPNNLSEMSIFDEQDFFTEPLAGRGVLNLRYRDDNNDGILDGSSPPVRVDSLSAWGLDETLDSWVQLPGAGADPEAKMLTVYFDKPGVYALLGSLVESIPSSFKAFPVPYRPYGPQAGAGQGQTGTEAGGITFEGVPQTGRIEIYTLDGRLVRKLAIPDNLTFPYRVVWDVRTVSGGRAASGTYIWRVSSGGNAKTGKLMVIW